MKGHWDALVVGGGPAGATTALVLARSGVKVLLVDKARFPRPKLCGGLLPRKTVDLVQRLHSLSPSQALRQGIYDSEGKGFKVFLGERPLTLSNGGHPFHFVNRTVFDAFLLERAQKAGASLRERTRVREAAPDQGWIRTDSGEVIKADCVIGCDGANSPLRRYCGVDRRAWLRDLAGAVEISLPREDAPRIVTKPELYSGFTLAGYCWAFPNRERVLYGACDLLRSRRNLSDSFLRFLQAQGVKRKDMPRLKGHPLPYGNFLPRPGKGKLLLAGDAAGLVEPLFGEGIYYAMRSGELAAQGLLKASKINFSISTLENYVQSLQREIMPEFRWAKRLRFVLFHIGRMNGALPIKGIAMDGGKRILETIHGERSFRFFKRRVV